MIECFIVLSEVIAFVCIGSPFAAVGTLLLSHRRIGADAGLTKANQMAEASIARFDSGSQATPHAGSGKPLSCATGEPSGCWNAKQTYHPALTAWGQAMGLPRAGWVGAQRLLAGLVLHQVRPGDRSATVSNSSRSSLSPGHDSVLARDAESLFGVGSGPEPSLKIKMERAGLPDLSLTPIETRFAELARSRLGSLAAKKRRGHHDVRKDSKHSL